LADEVARAACQSKIIIIKRMIIKTDMSLPSFVGHMQVGDLNRPMHHTALPVCCLSGFP
jgi:hypothetical protein